MSIENPADLDSFIADFGIEVGFGSESFKALFENAFGEGLGVEGTVPVLSCKSAEVDVLDLKVGDILAFNSKTFTVESIRGDGTGISQVFVSDAI